MKTSSLNKNALNSKIAGTLYLIIAIVGGFSIGYVQSEIFIPGNAGGTFQNLIQNLTLFKFGVGGDIAVLLLETVLTVLLYQLFKSFGKTSMLVATFSRLAMTIIMAVNVVFYLAPYVLTTQGNYADALGQTQVEAMALLFFQLHKYGELAWQVFFAIHLWSLGMVIRNSKLAPKALGVLMVVGSLGYAGESITQLVQVNNETTAMIFGALLVLAVTAEFWFAFWLLLKGLPQKSE